VTRTSLLCPNGHYYTEKHPLGRYGEGCPLCRIITIEKELWSLKRWLKKEAK
jgi:hypothetical protein